MRRRSKWASGLQSRLAPAKNRPATSQVMDSSEALEAAAAWRGMMLS